jgi:hypothetical protein
MREEREAQAVEKLTKDLGVVKDEKQGEDKSIKLNVFLLF